MHNFLSHSLLFVFLLACVSSFLLIILICFLKCPVILNLLLFKKEALTCCLEVHCGRLPLHRWRNPQCKSTCSFFFRPNKQNPPISCRSQPGTFLEPRVLPIRVWTPTNPGASCSEIESPSAVTVEPFRTRPSITTFLCFQNMIAKARLSGFQL